jgi:uroporphyrinogen-III synthase
MPTLARKVIGLLESRKAQEMATLVRRFGGEVMSAPTVREVRRHDTAEPAIRDLIAGRVGAVAILTAAAFEVLCSEAVRLGLLEQLLAALGQTPLCARGPKPLLALRKRGLLAHVSTATPHTAADLLEAMSQMPFDGKRVQVLHYGERSEELSTALTARRAAVDDVLLYEWALPEDTAPIDTIIGAAVEGRLDAMLFTSQVQLRHLMEIARRSGREDALTEALRDTVVIASIGPVCTRALRAAGMIPDVITALPNGPSLVSAVAEYFSMFEQERDW